MQIAAAAAACAALLAPLPGHSTDCEPWEYERPLELELESVEIAGVPDAAFVEHAAGLHVEIELREGEELVLRSRAADGTHDERYQEYFHADADPR